MVGFPNAFLMCFNVLKITYTQASQVCAWNQCALSPCSGLAPQGSGGTVSGRVGEGGPSRRNSACCGGSPKAVEMQIDRIQ